MPSLLFYLLLGRSIKSGEVTLHSDSKPISVFCHMGDFGCGDGGWTPIMKINGNKVTIYPRRNSLLKKDSGEKRQRGWAKSAAASLMKRQGSSRVARLSSLREAWNMLLLRSYRKWTCKFYSFYKFQGTFHYDSQFWRDRSVYNLPGGKTAFDLQETKLPTYWTTPFSKICLGMRIDNQLRFIVINQQADSLHSLIADGKYRKTSKGRDTWKTLIGSQASLQPYCNKEGFNAVGDNPRQSKARIGITANQQNDCSSCDSRIGFGTGGIPDDSNTCGNEARYSPDNGNRHIKAMGYILIQWQGTQFNFPNFKPRSQSEVENKVS